MSISKPWTNTSNAILFLVLITLMSSSCSKQNLVENQQFTFDISVELDELVVKKTCENDGTTGRADLYHTLRILRSNVRSPFQEVEIYQSKEILVEIGKNERVDPVSLASGFECTPKDGDRLTFAILIEEKDPGKVQVWQTFRYGIEYDADQNCWSELEDRTCLFENTERIRNISSRFSNGSWPGSPCHVDYEWSIQVRPQ